MRTAHEEAPGNGSRARISFDPPLGGPEARAALAKHLLEAEDWSENGTGELTKAGLRYHVRVVRTPSLELRFESLKALANADVRRFVAGLCAKLTERSSLVLEGVDKNGTRMHITLAPGVCEDDVRAALRRFDAALCDSMEWVPPSEGRTPNYHDLVWAAAARRVDELVQERAAFEDEFGQIEAAYWPHHRKIGAAVVLRHRR